MTIVAAFQSRAQLLARYGEADAAVILNNAAAVLLFGGTRDRDDLQFWSTLAGERDERITTTDLHGRVASRTVRRVPVLPPAQIANLPTGKVLLIRRGLGPVIGRAQMAWQRRDIRAVAFARKHPRWAARYTRCTTATHAVLVGGYARAAVLLGAAAAPLHVPYIVLGRTLGQAVQRILRRLRGRPVEPPSDTAQVHPSTDTRGHGAPWSAAAWPSADADHTCDGAAPDPGRRNGAPVDHSRWSR